MPYRIIIFTIMADFAKALLFMLPAFFLMIMIEATYAWFKVNSTLDPWTSYLVSAQE